MRVSAHLPEVAVLVVVFGQAPQDSSDPQPPSSDVSFVPPDNMRASLGTCCCGCALSGCPCLAEVGAGDATGWLDMQVALMEMDCCSRPALVTDLTQNASLWVMTDTFY